MAATMKTLPPPPGSKLKNGATIIGTIDARDRRYCLACRYREYVTWIIDDEGYAFHGEYFHGDQLREAVESLYARASEAMA